ncbi:cryptochrome/photolyase family protein [Flavobacterium degerlachei]|jgi:deoxyribodipyrimidine photolyase-related protein|uniref:Deoxyribodipyrimidine photolyase-related protein n=1 Tax=Flavobacterium degerlachei TaxID=229203 RepID=A0A1H2Q021_9FLAO|nr:cryptochrome/photolyase family protein [Flavobacterium degerlachei]SDW00441.1 deoxyribodipyrimidine photolyase-related protein [Flavobacterium degerlachei]
MKKTVRLILGDQLNSNHSWFKTVDDSVTYVMMEIRTETDYASHHIQKVVGIFSAMRSFSKELELNKHNIIYINLVDENNLQSFENNIKNLILKHNFTHFEYQLPDEFRVDEALKNLSKVITISSSIADSEHFFTTRNELEHFFEGKKTFVMENFYRMLRKKHTVLMEGNQPLTGKWNYDSDNRKKLPKNHKPTPPLVFNNNVSEVLDEISKTDIKTIGNIDAVNFVWPINREQSLQLLDFFLVECLPLFGSYQDAMFPNEWSLYHSRLSFSMNLKMISPKEVIDKAIKEWESRPNEIEYNQLEGFVRQIIGWREYMRGIYWLKMPEYASMNFFNNQEKLPDWFWTGNTKMNCLKDTINQSLNYAYAHHIQRLMITGNFALLAGIHPDELDAWYLGIYIDAIEWVEITNTRGMSQFADGGIVGTKPYVSSASYIDKMSHYCGSCYYKKAIKTGEKACPFNSLYWNFYDKNEEKLGKNPRIGMMYNVWRKMQPEVQVALLEQADYYLKNINNL